MKVTVKQAMIDSMKAGVNDEFDTPYYAVVPLARYIPKNSVVWDPAGRRENSPLGKAVRDHGSTFIQTDREEYDFITGEGTPPSKFDLIVTNPPFSKKDQFIERCISFGTPFAILLPITGLEGIKRGRLLNSMGEDFGVLVFDRRVDFTGKGKVWFNTSWFCYKLLPRQLVFHQLMDVYPVHIEDKA
jgi:hypothetical protein